MLDKALSVASDRQELRSILPFVHVIGPSFVGCFWIGGEDLPTRLVEELYVLKPEDARMPEHLVATIQDIVIKQQYTIVALPASRFGKEIAPRLAVALKAGYVEGVNGVEKADAEIAFRRLSYGGTAEEKIKIKTEVKIITVAQQRAVGPEFPEYKAESTVINLPSELDTGLKRLVEQREQEKGEDIRDADKIIAIGRGIKKKDDISMIQELATILKAKLACTRPLVEDLMWHSKDQQIGLSGNTVKPNLYMGIGVSGQVQHIVGMRDSKTIIAINKDKTAPIFQFADYGIVGDLYAIVPELIKELKKI